jgi:hypothetical protein
MDDILAKAGSQAVTFAIRSGISLALGYAIKTVVRFVEKLPTGDRKRIEALSSEIQTKTAIVSLLMDLIRLAAARGNTSLSPTLELINSVDAEIVRLDDHVAKATAAITAANERQLVESVLASMRLVLSRVEECIPFLQLSISTSGIQASLALPQQVSPGRLLQAANAVTSVLAAPQQHRKPVGPIFDATLYSIFYNPSRLRYVDDALALAISWKEDFARATAQILESAPFQYELEITEDFNDDRYHEDDAVARKHVVSIVDIARLFFSALGKLLKLEGNSSPVLILKLSPTAASKESSWLAFGAPPPSTNDSDDDASETDSFHDAEPPKELSLLLLEYIIRLLSLQANDRTSILDATDERLALYLKDEHYVLNSAYLKDSHDSANDESLTLDSNIKRLEKMKITKS